MVADPFLTNSSTLYPLKTPENQKFSGFFRGYIIAKNNCWHQQKGSALTPQNDYIANDPCLTSLTGIYHVNRVIKFLSYRSQWTSFYMIETFNDITISTNIDNK